MRKELPKQYDPTQVESQIYQMWLDNDCFKAEPDPDKKSYSIVISQPLFSAYSGLKLIPSGICSVTNETYPG